MRRPLVLALVTALASPALRVLPATAQPTPGVAPTSSAQVRAEALMAAGKKQIGVKDYAGALALFNDAYREYPDPKYFIAIGVALEGLNRDVEAAESYQQYLDSPSPEPARAADIQKALAAVDARLGKLRVAVLGPPSSQIQIANGDWAAPRARPWRVVAGTYVVRAQYPGRAPVEATGTVAAGQTLDVTIDLTPPRPAPPPPPPPPLLPGPTTTEPTTSPPVEPEHVTPPAEPAHVETPAGATAGAVAAVEGPAEPIVVGKATPRGPRRWSLFAGAIGAVVDPGVRGLVGIGFQPLARVRLGVDAIIGSGPGFAPRATLYVTTGRLRPTLNLGLPVRRLEHLDNPMGRPCAVASVDGTPRVSSFELAAHGGVGLEWQAAARWSLVAELGYERYLGIDTCLTDASVLTPAVGVIGRL